MLLSGLRSTRTLTSQAIKKALSPLSPAICQPAGERTGHLACLAPQPLSATPLPGQPLPSLLGRLGAAARLHTSAQQATVGNYDKLIAAAASTRGIGRSNKPKHTRKSDDDKYLKFNRTKAAFPGFHTPIGKEKKVVDQGLSARYDEPTLRQLGLYRPPPGSRKKFDTRFRGYSGRSWPGRYAGVPHTSGGDPIDGLQSTVMYLAAYRQRNRASIKTALVAVGNGNGLVGLASAQATLPLDAIRKARNRAAQQLVRIPLCQDQHGSKTIYHDMSIHVGKIRMRFERKPAGHGIRAQRMTGSIARLAGITDLRVKKKGRMGSRTNHCKAVLHGLQAQESHSELAERTGAHVVEYRGASEHRPVVVASPSPQAVSARMQRGADTINIADYLDGSRGAHKTKTLAHVEKHSSF